MSVRAVRGGSWFSRARYCWSAYRRFYVPGFRGINLGFRLAAGCQSPRRMLRGGGWFGFVRSYRSARRIRLLLASNGYDVGFRVMVG